MMCPHDPAGRDLGVACGQTRCWLWQPGRRGNCVALAVGSTTVMESDVRAMHQTTAVAVVASVARGRQKMASFLRVVLAAADAPDTGCVRCGRETCTDGRCHDGKRQISRFEGMLPLDRVLQMNAPRWRAAIRSLRRNGDDQVLNDLTIPESTQ